MIEPNTNDAIVREVARLDESDRRRVLEFVRSLAGRTPPGASGESLARLAGSIPHADMDEIEAAIEEGCEQVDPGGW